MQQNRYRPIEISHLIIPLEIIYLVIIYIVLYYHRYIINCYNTVAELYSCPELSLSRVQIHSIRSTSHLIALLFLDSAAFICCHRSRLFHTLLRISDSWLSYSRFSHLLFLAFRFSTSLFALALTLSFSFSLSLSFPIDFSSAKPVPTFHFVPRNIHSYPQPCDAFVHHIWNKCTLAYRKHTYVICARIYLYVHIYIHTHIHTHTPVRTHPYNTYTKYTYIIYYSHSHGLSSPL